MLFKIMDDQIFGLLLVGFSCSKHKAIAGHIHIEDVAYLGLERVLGDTRTLADRNLLSRELPE